MLAEPSPDVAAPRGVRKIKFRAGNHAGFYRELKRRVDAYFAVTGKNRFADAALVAKGALYGALAAGAYGLALADLLAPWARLVAGIAFGISVLLLAINIAHDAAHDALTPNRRFNRLVQTAIFTLLGANAYLWRMRHVKSHHTFPNVNGCDIDIDNNALLRLSPNQPRRWYHRFQHFYAPLIFWLVDVHTVFYQDFVYLFKKRLGNMTNIAHPAREYAMFAVCKLCYVAIIVLIPLAVVDLPWWQVAFGIAAMTFVSSVLFVSLLIGTHFALETEFPEVDATGHIGHDWAVHAIKTSIDWSPTSRLASFIAGGANAHAAHHLFPTVCHTHYVAITRIIQRTAAEYGLRCNMTSLPRLIASHWRFLRAMGSPGTAGALSPRPVRSPA